MNDFINFRDNFWRLWYEVAPHTIASIDYECINNSVRIRIEYMTMGFTYHIDRRFIFYKNIDYYDMVESLLHIYLCEDLHRRKEYNDK